MVASVARAVRPDRRGLTWPVGSGKGCWRFGGRMSVCEQCKHRAEHSGYGNPWARMSQLQRNGRAGREDMFEGWWEGLPACLP